jgi:hypothetical protein
MGHFRGDDPNEFSRYESEDLGPFGPGVPVVGRRLSSKINGKFIVVYIIWWFLNIGYD